MGTLFKPIPHVTSPLELREILAEQNKSTLNALYGLYADTDSVKEIKKMKREYIVVHSIDGGQVGIIFKDSIAAVLKTGIEQNTEVSFGDRSMFVSDSYEDIVKQLFK